jgi:hypothetical protein
MPTQVRGALSHVQQHRGIFIWRCRSSLMTVTTSASAARDNILSLLQQQLHFVVTVFIWRYRSSLMTVTTSTSAARDNLLNLLQQQLHFYAVIVF